MTFHTKQGLRNVARSIPEHKAWEGGGLWHKVILYKFHGVSVSNCFILDDYNFDQFLELKQCTISTVTSKWLKFSFEPNLLYQHTCMINSQVSNCFLKLRFKKWNTILIDNLTSNRVKFIPAKQWIQL